MRALEGLSAPREIRVKVYATQWLYWFYSLEYRSDGVWVWLHPGSLYAQNGWADGDMYRVKHEEPVTVGNPFVDSIRGITVAMLSSDASQATLQITRPSCGGGGGPGCPPACGEGSTP